jgi:Activator of Hsp90 ATPase homolog 1-like protein
LTTKENDMTDKNYTTTFAVDQSPAEAFAAINNVRGWWSEEIEGPTDKAGGTFKYHFQDLHRCDVRVDELVPGKTVSWTFVDSYFSFTKNAAEWKGTRIVFDIARKGDKTEITFTHVGLVPKFECYNACSDGWRNYINGSLKDLITTGRGKPNKGEAITESEQKLSR